jgi:hypothetical protein
MSVQHGNGGFRKTPKHVYAWRFVAGHHMSGARHTNYTFRYRATRDLTNHGRASKWAHRAGYERASIRIGATAITLAILYGYFTNRAITEDTLAGAFAGLIIGLSIRGKYAFANHKHHKRVVRPLYQTITQITAMNTIPSDIHAYGANHKRVLTVPRNYRDEKARIRLMVPQTWEANPALIKRIADLIERRLGGDWDAHPNLHQYPPFIEFAPSPSPPKSLSFKEMRAVLDSGKPNEIIIGKGTHNRTVTIELDAESPHVAISMGTGGGKSALLRVIVSYLIHHGVTRIDIVDPKRVSHDWAKGIPGVHIHRTMAEQMAAISAFRKRMEVRYEELGDDAEREFPREVLVIEEQNSWMSYAKTYWDDYRNELDSQQRGKVSKANPAISDLAYILFQGRQARMNVISVFQSMSASAAGGRDLRENYGAKILARYSPQTWTMLVGTRPIPRSSRIPGRARYVLGDEDREIQMILVSAEDAKAYALETARADADMSTVDPLLTVSADGAGSDEPEPAMTLREMCDAGIVPIRYSAAKRARTRAGVNFPSGKRSPVGTVYDPRIVRAHFEARRETRWKQPNAN